MPRFAKQCSEQPLPLLVGCRRWLEQCYAELRPQSTEPLADPAQLELLDLPLPEPVRPGQAGPRAATPVSSG